MPSFRLFLFLFLVGYPAEAFDRVYLRGQIADCSDRVLLAEDDMADEQMNVEKGLAALKRLKGSQEAFAAKKIRETEFETQQSEKKVAEFREAILVQRAQCEVWKAHLKNREQPSATSEQASVDAYRTLWRHRRALYQKMQDTAWHRYEYELAYWKQLERLSESGAVPAKSVIEADHRTKCSWHEWDLAKKRTENAQGQFE